MLVPSKAKKTKILSGKKSLTETTKNLKVPNLMENIARFVSILRGHVSLKTLMGISTLFVKEL